MIKYFITDITLKHYKVGNDESIGTKVFVCVFDTKTPHDQGTIELSFPDMHIENLNFALVLSTIEKIIFGKFGKNQEVFNLSQNCVVTEKL